MAIEISCFGAHWIPFVGMEAAFSFLPFLSLAKLGLWFQGCRRPGTDIYPHRCSHNRCFYRPDMSMPPVSGGSRVPGSRYIYVALPLLHWNTCPGETNVSKTHSMGCYYTTHIQCWISLFLARLSWIPAISQASSTLCSKY